MSINRFQQTWLLSRVLRCASPAPMPGKAPGRHAAEASRWADTNEHGAAATRQMAIFQCKA